MCYYSCLFISLLLICTTLTGQPKTDAYLQQILNKNTNSIFTKVLQHPDTYRLQIIYTQINRDKNNKASFTNYYFHYDPALYFNPASMVKMPLAFLSLEKLNNLRQKGVNKNTTILFDSSQPWQRPLYKDTSAAAGTPSIAHFIKRAFLISENDPYNRMYQFLGQEAINRNLHQKGYKEVRITRQFLGLTPEQNRHTNAIRFVDDKGSLLYSQPAGYTTLILSILVRCLK